MTDSVCLVHINPRVCSCPCSVETRTEAEVCIGSRIVSTLLLRSNGDWLSAASGQLRSRFSRYLSFQQRQDTWI
jgi:hypothetical protein